MVAQRKRAKRKGKKKKFLGGEEKLAEALILCNVKLELRLKGEGTQVTKEARPVRSFIAA